MTDVAHIKNFIKANISLSNVAKNTFAPTLYKFYPDTPGKN